MPRITHVFFRWTARLLVLCILLATLTGLGIWAFWVLSPEVRPGDIVRAEVEELPGAASEMQASVSPDVLTVMTYNLGFASGPHQETLADPHPPLFFADNLEQVARMMADHRVDVLLLQEADLGSTRSHFTNQVQWLQTRLDMPYAATATAWDVYLPLRPEGRIVEGKAILSRLPLSNHAFQRFACKPTFDNPAINALYHPLLWKAVVQRVDVEWNGRPVTVVNAHMPVWRRAYRVRVFEELLRWLDAEPPAGGPGRLVFGGDLNLNAHLRTTTERLEDQDEEPYFAPIWTRQPGIQEAFIDAATPLSDIHALVSYPEHGERYDFLFFGKDFVRTEAGLVGTIHASDHLPVYVRLREVP